MTNLFTFTVSGLGAPVTDVDFRLSVLHSAVGDLDVFLISPNGTQLALTNVAVLSQGGPGDNFQDTYFDEQGGVARIGTTSFDSAPFAGPEYGGVRYKTQIASNSLNVFNGIDPNGIWTLEIVDQFGGDDGFVLRSGDDPRVLENQLQVKTTGDGWGSVGSKAIGTQLIITVPAVFTLSATTAGGGTVSLTPPTGPYPSGAVVSAVANPSAGFQFLHWLGDLSGTSATNSVTMTRNKSVRAVFGTTLATGVTGSGSVNLQPVLALYPFGSAVHLTAVPQVGRFFSSWSNPISSTNNPVDFLVANANPSVIAAFALLTGGESALTVIADGYGQAVANPSGNHFANGTVVQLTAMPDAGQSFLGWSGDASGSNSPLSVLLNESKTITASFTRRPILAISPGDVLPGTDGVRVTVRGAPGAVFEIDGKPVLTDAWLPIGMVTNDFGETQFLDTAATNGTQRYYRALVVP